MNELENTLVIIPARGGSKGLPGKNSKLLHGKPLIYYTIDAARDIVDDEHICLSTDDPEIKRLAEEYQLDVPFVRPDYLAADDVGTYEVLIHALDHYESLGKIYDQIILLQPTSPLRTGEHIKEALALYSSEIDMVVSVKETSSNPYYVLFEESPEGYLQKSKLGTFERRQDCPKVWEYNGAIYIINAASLREHRIHQFSKVKKYVMDAQSSQEIDNGLDWLVVEHLLQRRNSEAK